MKKTNGVKAAKPAASARNISDAESHKGIHSADFRIAFQDYLKYHRVKDESTATPYDRYLSLAYAIRDRLVENWVATQKTYRENKIKRVYYLSLEFLMGRTLGNSIINLQAENAVTKGLAEMGLRLEDLRGQEIDAGLGNGNTRLRLRHPL